MGEYDTPIVSIVDDDESLRRSLRNLLASAGFRVETFASAEAFLQSIHKEQTGCLVLDLRMPGMKGPPWIRADGVPDKKAQAPHGSAGGARPLLRRRAQTRGLLVSGTSRWKVSP